ncbi:MAG: Rpp14/Pop5 family protein [Candidatus Micrarchaeota archaeon]|nr:Rpp14/Pop5 family protein [Candidatus Micrarchaeota archaeon]
MMREKRRYLLVRSTMGIQDMQRRDFEQELYREMLRSIGEYSYFRSNPKIVKYLDSCNFIMKCNLAKYGETIIALTFIKRISGREVGFYTLKSSGTIRALMK